MDATKIKRNILDTAGKTLYLYETFQYAVITICVVLVLIPLYVPFYIYLLLIAADVIGFFIYKEISENKNTLYRLFCISVISLMFILPDFMLEGLSHKLNKKTPALISIVFGSCFALLGCYLFFFDGKKKKEVMLKLNLLKTDEIKKEIEIEGQKYDVVLCKNKETGEDVILEEDARYVHGLCIGPTGCGKTSQVITPMILQDIKNGRSVLVIEPKGDLAEKVYAMGKYYKKDVIYFNPINPDCPSFNPLDGKEDEVIETLTTTFNMLSPDSITYFKDITDNLIRRSVMVLKRIEEVHRDPDTGISSRPATLLGVSDILHNTENRGRDIMNDLLQIPTLTASEEKQNKDTVDWFLNEYYADRSKVYENASGIRQQVSKLIQNKHLRKVLNPENGKSDVDFDRILAESKSIAISTAQGALRELSSYLGYFIIFSLQSAIFRRPGNEFTRVPSFLYIDEFQKYANSGMSDILTQGRSYRVATMLATQSREQITMGSGREGKAFLEVVTANARNVIAFPGISQQDAKFFSLSFGEETRIEERHGQTKQKFSIAYGFRDMNYPTESVQTSEVTKAKFSESEITYKPFSEITYRIIKDKSVQMAQNGIASWIPKDINDELTKIVNLFNEEQQAKRDAAEKEQLEQKRKLYNDYRRGMVGGGITLNDLTRNTHEKKTVKSSPANVGNRKFQAPVEDRYNTGESVGNNEDEERTTNENNGVYDDEAINQFNEQMNHFNEPDGNFFGDF